MTQKAAWQIRNEAVLADLRTEVSLGLPFP